MNVLEVAVTEAFGERCPDYEPECPCCMAWKALDNSKRQSKIIDELVEAGASAAQRLRYCGDLWYDQGLESRAEADWEASDRLNLLISKAQSHKPNEGQRDE